MTNDIYGNPDPFVLFFDRRSGTNVWYPGHYINHPVWSEYLTVSTGTAPRPSGMYHGSIYQPNATTSVTYPGATTFPGSTTFPGQSL